MWQEIIIVKLTSELTYLKANKAAFSYIIPFNYYNGRYYDICNSADRSFGEYILSRRQHGSPWSSLVTRLYRPSLSVGLQD